MRPCPRPTCCWLLQVAAEKAKEYGSKGWSLLKSAYASAASAIEQTAAQVGGAGAEPGPARQGIPCRALSLARRALHPPPTCLPCTLYDFMPFHGGAVAANECTAAAPIL